MTMRHNANAAVFLDRDGTIIEDRGHLREPSGVFFFPDTFEALQKLQRHLLLFIVTNQPGVAKGLITRNDVDRVNAHVIAALAEQGVEIRDFYVCPHGRLKQCPCMKPKPYFLREAAERYGVDLSVSFTVGDHPHDVQLAGNAGASGIYVLTGHGLKHLDDVPRDTQIASGIGEAAEMILSRHTAGARRRRPKPMQKPFLLNLMVAHDLWWRPDLGDAPRNAEHVARVLREAGIEVYEVSGGWLECEPRPAGIREALTGRPAPADWAAQFDCPPERQGRVLRLLAAKAIPVCDCEGLVLEKDTLAAGE
jgi:histidinol-phosphate phosphatase family protein